MEIVIEPKLSPKPIEKEAIKVEETPILKETTKIFNKEKIVKEDFNKTDIANVGGDEIPQTKRTSTWKLVLIFVVFSLVIWGVIAWFLAR